MSGGVRVRHLSAARRPGPPWQRAPPASSWPNSANPRPSWLTDFAQPAALLLVVVAILHFITDQDNPARIVSAFRHALPAGSYLAIAHATADFRPCGEAGGRRLRPSYLTGRIAQSRAGYRVLRRLGSGRAGPGPGPIVAARRQAAPAAGAGPGLGLRRGGPQEHMTAEGASHRPHQNPSGRTNHGSRSGNPFAHPDEGARRAGAVSLGCRKGRAAQQ